ncbi:MAG TPA: phospholipase D-like domain-containing protein [Pirellulales bacterium]|nr:phospholipase D-like domain-containing protein [Pirellulales bacterium]
MEKSRRLLDYYLPPGEGFVLESLIATTYQVDFEFLEEELLASALGVRSPVNRIKAFRSELERGLQKADVSILYDLRGCERLVRLSPRIDAIPVSRRKLHSKISLLMWARDNSKSGAPPDRCMRLVVGSANLTRQGFRQNYECVAAIDFDRKRVSPTSLLKTAIGLVRQICADRDSPQLQRQLAAFSAEADILEEGTGPELPVALVAADDVVPTLRNVWTTISDKAPESLTIVSPFWAEGVTATDALVQLAQQLGAPPRVELVCSGERSADGKLWLPVFEAAAALELRRRLSGQLFLCATLPEAAAMGVAGTDDIGDELEDREFATRLGIEKNKEVDTHRALHAKTILLDGRDGSTLYIGSSNCTRRGLGLGAAANHEAGFIYQLTPRHRKQVASLLGFVGPPIEVLPDAAPSTVQPTREEECAVPSFLEEVVASGGIISIGFRETVPRDLVLLMPIPTKAGSAGNWLLFRGNGENEPPQHLEVHLDLCGICDERLEPIAEFGSRSDTPNVYVEARWEGHTANFPVRFDEKTQLPLLLVGRKPSEGELIDYFLFGREPNEWGDGLSFTGNESTPSSGDEPVDTRYILTYFIRRFVRAIPGIEAEIKRAAYSRAPLTAVLRGPTSPLELAERAFASLTTAPAKDEPSKTPTAVGFQLVEICAVLQRSRAEIAEIELRVCFDPVTARCREMLRALEERHPELGTEAFRRYKEQILGCVE